MPLSANEIVGLMAAAGAGAAVAAWALRRAPAPGADDTARDAERLLREQDRVLELIAGGATLTDALHAIVRLIEELLPGAGSVMRAEDGQRLRLVARTDRLPALLANGIDGLPIAEGSAICGTAAARRREVIVADLTTDPLAADYREVIRVLGLRSCWSVPILAGDEVLGTFALYFTTERTPNAADRAALAAASRLTRIAIEHERRAVAGARSQALLRELADNIREVFYVRDARTGDMLYVSPSYQRVWGRTVDSLYQQPLSAFDGIHPDDRAAALALRQRQDRGEMTLIEYRVVDANGGVRWIQDRTYPVRSPAGDVERVVGIALDLTEQKQADLRLASMNRSLEMLSQCNEALALSDDEPALLRQICQVAVRAGGYRMAWVGYVDAERGGDMRPVAYAGFEEGYLSEIRLSALQQDPTGSGPVATALRSGEAVVCGDIATAEGFYWRKAALQRGYRSIVCLPLHVRGRVLGILALYSGRPEAVGEEEVRLLQELAGNLALGIAGLRERTERKRVQEEVQRLNAELEQRVQQRTAQLAAVNRDLESFSYSLAHDLRAPLAAIDGFSQALVEAAGERLGEREQHYAQRVRAGAQRMAEMIDALLSLARLSRAPLQWTRVDLGAMARAELDGLAEREPQRVVQCEVQDGLVAHGDARLLHLVIQNLVGNAWKFTAQRPDARIEVGQHRSTEGQTVFFVRDNGIGFDMAHADQLFDPFHRLHAGTDFAGTGLGLANCQRIIDRHGGRITAQAAPDAGATFEFTLADRPPEPPGIIGAG